MGKMSKHSLSVWVIKCEQTAKVISRTIGHRKFNSFCVDVDDVVIAVGNETRMTSTHSRLTAKLFFTYFFFFVDNFFCFWVFHLRFFVLLFIYLTRLSLFCFFFGSFFHLSFSFFVVVQLFAFDKFHSRTNKCVFVATSHFYQSFFFFLSFSLPLLFSTSCFSCAVFFAENCFCCCRYGHRNRT